MMALFKIQRIKGDEPVDYDLMNRQLAALAAEEAWYVPFMANAAALLYDTLPDINWAGFYLVRDGGLVLGPFQGKPACIHIPSGKGVCGTALAQGQTVRVEDVHLFPGHIACDSASNSEIVVPLRKDGHIVAVLDIDSPLLRRFDQKDQAGLEAFVRTLEENIQFA